MPPVVDDDVVPMHDMFDVTELEEIRAWKMRQWGQVLMSTLALYLATFG